jgi:nicotinate-nucleotide--dimethylbenzimidazole phosphoribosyltransferase
MIDFALARTADPQLALTIAQRIDGKTKPQGALGRMETLAAQIGLILRTPEPLLVAPHLLVFAADHGVTAAGVSLYPQDVTWQMVMNYIDGGAAANVFAANAGMQLRVVDAGVNHRFATHRLLIDRKVGPGTRNLAREAAMSRTEAELALAHGAALTRELASAGTNVIGFGEMGIGNTTAASALMARLTGLPVDRCAGRGTGLDDAALAHKRSVIMQALALHADAKSPLDVLAALGGYEIAMIAGAFIGAAQARMVIIVDGFIVGAALLVAHAFNPAVLDYCVFAHQSDEHGHAAMLRHLGAAPLLCLGMRLGEGTGAALAYPLVRAAALFLTEMASFESAGVARASPA